MDLEAGIYGGAFGGTSWRTTLVLAYQSFGVVYGDLSISPLYVFKSALAGTVKIKDDETEILGVLSLVFWTLTLIPLAKYAFVGLKANDNGEGGTFALYSLLCRHTKLNHMPNQQQLDEELSTYNVERASQGTSKHAIISFLERHKLVHNALLIMVLLGTCMMIGDGVLTPPISVLAAVSGIDLAAKHIEEHLVVLLACVILIGLFSLQQCGTQKVAFMFAPIIIAWLFCISSIGIYNICRWNPGIYRGLSPYYIYKFFQETRKDGWMSLGGVVLCVTGVEAMFADMGHFSQRSIKLAFICAVYPCLILAYMGQAAFLTKNRQEIEGNFYKAIPKPVFWPVFIIATLASCVGSQAIISATFSIVKQCSALGCFPHVKIVHTSRSIIGQIYVPEMNWILMILCLSVTIGFRNTTLIGNAYGLAVVTVMLVTTCLMTLVIIIVWRKSLFLALLFFFFFGFIEAVYLSSCLIKVHLGGWVPVVLALIFMLIMYTWNYGMRKKYEFDMQNKVSLKWLLTLGPSLGVVRVRGMGLIYTELVSGVPAVFSHFVTNLPAFHQIVVFVCIRSVPVPYIPPSERFLLGRVGPREYRIYRCIVRYGYKDVHEDDVDFEDQLVLNMGEFIKSEAKSAMTSPGSSEFTMDERVTVVRASDQPAVKMVPIVGGSHQGDDSNHSVSSSQMIETVGHHFNTQTSGRRKQVRFELPESPQIDLSVVEELRELIRAKEAGVAYILGHSIVKASGSSSLIKKIAINFGFNFLSRNCRGPSMALSIPHTSLIEVGMIYHV
ncbi:hypothetical protein L7F22_003992 [Adiantum nelumboides]|nr:hypothetical protein [Adiantum nelumboides]